MLRTAKTLFMSLVVLQLAAMGLAAAPVAAAPSPARATPAPSDCVVQTRRTLTPEILLQGETATVTLALTPNCPQTESSLHVVLAVDASASANSEVFRQMKEESRRLVRFLFQSESDKTRIGVVSFDRSARTWCPLTDDPAKLDACLDRLRQRDGSAIQRGLQAAYRVLQDGKSFESRRMHVVNVLVLVSAGEPERDCDKARREARRIRDAGVLMISVDIDGHVPDRCLVELASSPRYYFETIDSLLRIFVPVVPQWTRVSNPVVLRNLTLVDSLDEDLLLVESSAAPPAVLAPDGRSSSWSFPEVRSLGITVSYRVRAMAPGRPAIRGQADFLDDLNVSGRIDVPTAWLTALAPIRDCQDDSG